MTDGNKQERRRSRRLQNLAPEQIQPPAPVVVRQQQPRPFRCGNENYVPYASCFAFPRDAPIEENPDGASILQELARTHGEKKEEEDEDDLDLVMLRPVMADEFRKLVERKKGT